MPRVRVPTMMVGPATVSMWCVSSLLANFRGGDGNVGMIRSPVRAIALPDSGETSASAG